MRILVCGGREFDDLRLFIPSIKPYLEKNNVIIEGGAKGADFLARCFGKYYGLEIITFPADWKQHGKDAGPIRNKEMLAKGKPDIVLAFPGGFGTRHVTSIAQREGIEVKYFTR